MGVHDRKSVALIRAKKEVRDQLPHGFRPESIISRAVCLAKVSHFENIYSFPEGDSIVPYGRLRIQSQLGENGGTLRNVNEGDWVSLVYATNLDGGQWFTVPLVNLHMSEEE